MFYLQKGINKNTNISLILKEMYLEATALRCGVQAAQDLYKKYTFLFISSNNNELKILRTKKCHSTWLPQAIKMQLCAITLSSRQLWLLF